jgi:hypothetical protein
MEGEQPSPTDAASTAPSLAPSAAAPPSSPAVDVAHLRRKLAAAEARVVQLESALVESQAELSSMAEALQKFRTKHTKVLESSSKQLTELRSAFRKERQHNLLYEKILASKQAELDGLQRAAAGAGSVVVALGTAGTPNELAGASAAPACEPVLGNVPSAGESSAAGDIGALHTTSRSSANGLRADSASAAVPIEALARQLGSEQAPSGDATTTGSRPIPTIGDRLPLPHKAGLPLPNGAGSPDPSALASEVRRLRVEARSLRREARRSRRAEMLLSGVVVSEAVFDRTQGLLRWTPCTRLVPRGLRLSRDRERVILSHAPGESSLLGDTWLELHKLHIVFGTGHPGMQRLCTAIRPAPPPPWLCFSLVEEHSGRAVHLACNTEGVSLAVALALREQAAARRADLGWGQEAGPEEVEEMGREVSLDGLAVEDAGELSHRASSPGVTVSRTIFLSHPYCTAVPSPHACPSDCHTAPHTDSAHLTVQPTDRASLPSRADVGQQPTSRTHRRTLAPLTVRNTH